MLSLAPYLWFRISGLLVLIFGALAQAVLPPQGALIVAEVCCMLGFALFMRHHWPPPEVGWPSWRPRRADAVALPLAFAAGALFGLTANAIGAAVASTTPAMRERALSYGQQVTELLNPEAPLLAALAICSVTIFAPLCEEALFRGTLLPVQRDHEPFWLAIALNGLLFSLLHMNLVAFPALWLLGAVVAHLTLRSKSLLPAIACHAGVNTCNGVLLPAVARAQGIDPATSLPSLTEIATLLAILLPLAALAWAGLIHLFHRLDVTPHADEAPR